MKGNPCYVFDKVLHIAFNNLEIGWLRMEKAKTQESYSQIIRRLVDEKREEMIRNGKTEKD